jgi:hypothetical protein
VNSCAMMALLPSLSFLLDVLAGEPKDGHGAGVGQRTCVVTLIGDHANESGYEAVAQRHLACRESEIRKRSLGAGTRYTISVKHESGGRLLRDSCTP